MDRSSLTRDQAVALRDRIDPMVRFLFACRRRMAQLRFAEDGPMFQTVEAACCALHELRVALHCASVGREIGRPDEPGINPTDQA
jgi:hypothetical protein